MSAKFNRLANKVAAEYRRKGVSAATARKWGQGTAAKIARIKGRAKGRKG